MAIFAVVGVVAVLAYLYGQKRAASRRLREAVARTLAECESNAGLAADGVPIGRERFDAARRCGAFDTAPVHLVVTLHQAYDRPSREAFGRAAAQLAEYRDFHGWKG